MPELPEVETVSRTLQPLLRERQIQGFELRWDRTLSNLSDEEFRLRTIGGIIHDVSRRGKLVLLELDDGNRVSIHLRMTGELRVFAPDVTPDRERERYLRAALTFDDGSSLGFFDVRKFGRITFLTSLQYDCLDATLGIEPLSPDFTAELLAKVLQSRARAIKSLLLDQTVIAGLGNIYVDEALFASRIHPLTRSNTVSAQVAGVLQESIVNILQSSIARHGTTLRDYRTGLGQSGSNQSHLRIYGLKRGSPCAVCASPIDKLVVGQRGTVYCPVCQPVPEYASSIALPTSGSDGSSTG